MVRGWSFSYPEKNILEPPQYYFETFPSKYSVQNCTMNKSNCEFGETLVLVCQNFQFLVRLPIKGEPFQS